MMRLIERIITRQDVNNVAIKMGRWELIRGEGRKMGKGERREREREGRRWEREGWKMGKVGRRDKKIFNFHRDGTS